MMTKAGKVAVAALSAALLAATAGSAGASPPNPSWTCSAQAATVNVGGPSGGTLDPLHANGGRDSACNDDGATLPMIAASDVLGSNTVTLTSGNAQALTGMANPSSPTYVQAPAAAAQISNTHLNLGGPDGLTVTAKLARSYVAGQCRGSTPVLWTPDGPDGGEVVDLRINGTPVPAEGEPDKTFTQVFQGISPLAPIVRVVLNGTTQGSDPGTGETYLRREAVRIELLTAPDAAPLATIVLGSATVDHLGDVCATPPGVAPPGADGNPLVAPPPLLLATGASGNAGGGGNGGGSGTTPTPNNGRNASKCARLRMYFDLQRHGRPHRSGPKRITSRRGIRRVVRGRIRTCSGRAIVRARIDVIHVLGRHKRLVKTGLRSRPGGKLTLILPNNLTTRAIVFRYRPFIKGTAVAARQRLHIRIVRRRHR